MSRDNPTPAERELLALLAEECGEVVQIVGKCLRHGILSWNPNVGERPNNQDLLEKELGDLFAAVELLENYGVVAPHMIAKAKASKLERVGEYLHHADVKKRA